MVDRAIAGRWMAIGLAAAFAVCLALFGGASRIDEIGQIVPRTAAILVIGYFGVRMTPAQWTTARWPLIGLGFFAAIILVQLVPLPPGVSLSLPGRAPFRDVAAAAAVPMGWRPLSLTPDLTLNSALSLLVPLAMLVLLVGLSPWINKVVMPVILTVIAGSIMLQLLQFSLGGPYLYNAAGIGAGRGIFSNQNHQALLVAMALPLLACWAQQGPGKTGNPVAGQVRSLVAYAAAIAVFPVLLVTGSRGGLLLAAIAAVLSAIMMMAARPVAMDRRRLAAIIVLTLTLLGAMVALFWFQQRADALRRVLSGDAADVRSAIRPYYVRMALDFLPFGAGFGSFDPVYRLYEPFRSLFNVYLNHAHNDYAELIIEGGAPAAILEIAALVVLGRAALGAWRGSGGASEALYRRTGSIVILLVAISSAFDYPMRTPTIAALFMIGSWWLLAPPHMLVPDRRSRKSFGSTAPLRYPK